MAADGKTDHFRFGDSSQTNCGGGGHDRQRRPGLEREKVSVTPAPALVVGMRLLLRQSAGFPLPYPM